MTTEMSQQSTAGFQFGLESSRATDRLKEIIAKIEKGDIIVQGVKQSTDTRCDDFEIESFTLRFTERN